MKEIKQHEYDLLQEIGRDSRVTQVSLSKRLIGRGWGKVTHLDRTRLQYDLTAERMAMITPRAVQYMKSSL